jgi:hypothetical protein
MGTQGGTVDKKIEPEVPVESPPIQEVSLFEKTLRGLLKVSKRELDESLKSEARGKARKKKPL